MVNPLDKAKAGFTKFVSKSPQTKAVVKQVQESQERKTKNKLPKVKTGTRKEVTLAPGESIDPVTQEKISPKPQPGIEPIPEQKYVTYTHKAYGQWRDKTRIELWQAKQDYQQTRANLIWERSQIDYNATYDYPDTPEKENLTGEQVYNIYTSKIKEYDKGLKDVTKYEQDFYTKFPRIYPYTVIKREKHSSGELGGFVYSEDIDKKAQYSWERSPDVTKIGRTVYAGITNFPRVLFGGFLDMKKTQKEIIRWEHQAWMQKEKGDYGGLFVTTFTSPTVTDIVVPLAGGFGIGRLTSRSISYVGTRWGSRAALGMKAGLGVTGVAMATPSVIDIKSSFDKGDSTEGFQKLIRFGGQVSLGVIGYKSGSTSPIMFGKYKGLTPTEVGAMKGELASIKHDVKLGNISPSRGKLLESTTREFFWHKQQLSGVNVSQADVNWGSIESFKQQSSLKRFFSRHLIRRRSEVYGGAASDKPSTHDLDVMYRSALGKVEAEYGVSRLTGQPVSKYADVKPWQRTGSQVDLYGGIKQPSVKTPSGINVMSYREQFGRLGASSLKLAHEGRIKDIPESIRMLELLYSKSGGWTPETRFHFESYKTVMGDLYSSPRIMSPATSSKLYGSGLGKKWYDLKVSFWKKILPSSVKESSFKTTYGVDKIVTPPVTKTTMMPFVPSVSYIPSSISIGVIPSVFSSSITTKPSISTSVSKVKPPSIQPISSTSIKTKPKISISRPSKRFVTSPPVISPPKPKSPSFSSPTISSIMSSSPISLSISSPKSSSSISTSPSFYPSIHPKLKPLGIGTQSFKDLSGVFKKYKFRKFKVGDLF